MKCYMMSFVVDRADNCLSGCGLRAVLRIIYLIDDISSSLEDVF